MMGSDEYQQEIQHLKQRVGRDEQDETHRETLVTEQLLRTLEENYLQLSTRFSQLHHGPMTFHPILQITRDYLKADTRGSLIEVALQGRCDNQPVHVWTNKAFEHEQFYKDFSRLIGVANIELKGLFSCSKLDYTVPIINTDGQISGSLHAILDHRGSLSMERSRDYQINSMTSISEIDRESIDEGIEDTRSLFHEKNDQITIKFMITEIRDVNVSTDDPLMCHYTVINPKLDQTVCSSSYDPQTKTFTFPSDLSDEYTFTITNQFLDRCLSQAISIEIWHRSTTIPRPIDRSNRLIDRLIQSWRDVKRHVQFSVEIQELNSVGQWIPVEIDVCPGNLTGGVYRLKQGQTKRLVVQLRVLPQPSTLPFAIEQIQRVQIGAIDHRKIDAPIQLDSYDEEDLNVLRSQWYALIDEEKRSCEEEIHQLHDQQSYHAIERQSEILEELVELAEERNLLEFPPARCGLPGSPAQWTPPVSIERHRPILFCQSKSSSDGKELMEEHRNDLLTLPIIHHSTETSVIAQWNPSIHDAISINQCTPSDSIIYLIVRVSAMIGEPIGKELVFRKRIAVTISKGDSWWNVKTLKTWMNGKSPTKTSVVYEVISEIPQTIHRNRKTSTNLLVDHVHRLVTIGSKIERLMLLDRLRQEVLLSEKCPLIRQSLQDRHRTPFSSLLSLEQDLTIGDRIMVNTGHQIVDELGYVRYIGKFHLHDGLWYGIELDRPIGKHNGKLDGRAYFQCQDQHGIFVRREKLSKWR